MKNSIVILTKFNLRLSSFKNSRLEKIDVATDENYLKERFRLFETYTVPSIKNQTNQNFIWMVFFSDATPKQYKDRIANIQKEVKQFKPIFLTDKEKLSEKTNQELHKLNSDFYTTIRMDNDDALSINYVGTVVNLINNTPLEKTVFVFNNGCQYDEKHQILSKYHFPKNHFSTMVSKKEPTIDVITNYNHIEIANFIDNLIESENKDPLWLEVVHDTNVSNRTHMKRKDIVYNKAAFSIFGISHKNTSSKTKTIAYLIFQKPLNLIRISTQYNPKMILSKVKQKARKSWER